MDQCQREPSHPRAELLGWLHARHGSQCSPLRSVCRLHITVATDRWVVFHFHIDLDTRTFLPNADNWYLGVVTVGLYHGQDIVRPAAVTLGYPAEHVRWWQLQYWELANYNTRTQALSCNIGD